LVSWGGYFENTHCCITPAAAAETVMFFESSW